MGGLFTLPMLLLYRSCCYCYLFLFIGPSPIVLQYCKRSMFGSLSPSLSRTLMGDRRWIRIWHNEGICGRLLMLTKYMNRGSTIQAYLFFRIKISQILLLTDIFLPLRAHLLVGHDGKGLTLLLTLCLLMERHSE